MISPLRKLKNRHLILLSVCFLTWWKLWKKIRRIMKYPLSRCKRASTRGWRNLFKNSKFPHRTRSVVIRPLPTSVRLKGQVQSPPLIKTRSRQRQTVMKVLIQRYLRILRKRNYWMRMSYSLELKSLPMKSSRYHFRRKSKSILNRGRRPPRLTTQESAVPFDTITRLHLTQRESMVSLYKC